MSLWEDFKGDYAYEIYHDGWDPMKLYYGKTLGVYPHETKKTKPRTDGFYSIIDHLSEKTSNKKH